ncbi:MAG: hypothetical protein IT179_02195 [Acidobacteria bacterium]|nr:hypothetical protein [Acidobacteriota bacterium]
MIRLWPRLAAFASALCLSVAAPALADVTIRGQTVTREINLVFPSMLGPLKLDGEAVGQALENALSRKTGNREIDALLAELRTAIEKPTHRSAPESFVLYLRSRADSAIMRMDVGSQSLVLADVPARAEVMLVVFDHDARAFQTVVKLRGAARQRTGANHGSSATTSGATRTLLGHRARQFRLESAVSAGGTAELPYASLPVDVQPTVSHRVDAWLSSDIAGADEVRDFYARIAEAVGGDPRTLLPGLLANMASLTRSGLPLEMVDVSLTALLLWENTASADVRKPIGGFPLGGDSTTTTVSAVTTDPIPDAVFSLDAPPGYQPMPSSEPGWGGALSSPGLAAIAPAAGPGLSPAALATLSRLHDTLAETGSPTVAAPASPAEATAGTPEAPPEPGRDRDTLVCDCSCAGFEAYTRAVGNPAAPLTHQELSAQAMCARQCASQWKGCRRR